MYTCRKKRILKVAKGQGAAGPCSLRRRGKCRRSDITGPAAGHGNLRSRKPRIPRYGRDRRHGGNPGRKNAAANARSSSAAKRASNGNTWCRTANGSCALRRRGQGGSALVDGPLVPTTSSACPAKKRSSSIWCTRSERLPQPARGDQRQAHRDHHRRMLRKVKWKAPVTQNCCPVWSSTASTSGGSTRIWSSA